MVWKFSSWTMKTKLSLAFKTGSARAVMGGWGANWLNSVKIFYFFCRTFSSFASTWFWSLWLHQPRHCPNKIQGIKNDTLSVLGASPLKKPAAPSSFAITLKQSIIPLYDWTLPKLSLAWWKPCTLKKWGAPLIDHHYIFHAWHWSYDSKDESWDEWFTCITMGLFCLLTWSDPWLPVHRKIIMKQITEGSVGIYSVPIPIISTGLVAFKGSIPQHEQFYPEHLSVFVPFPLGWIKLAQKFKDFPPPTAIFKDFQGLEF